MVIGPLLCNQTHSSSCTRYCPRTYIFFANIMRSASCVFYSSRLREPRALCTLPVFSFFFFFAARSRKHRREDYHGEYMCRVSYHLINAPFPLIAFASLLVALLSVYLYLYYLNYYQVIVITVASCVNRSQICIVTCQSAGTEYICIYET